jgi:hypothetical protein
MIVAMSMKRSLGVIAVSLAALAVSAFAQFDAAGFANDLKTKFGPPLARQTFTVRPGLEMTVNYAANGHVCRIDLPPEAPEANARVIGPHAIDEFVSELVPMDMRGKELNHLQGTSGAFSLTTAVLYENVAIAESFQGDTRTRVTVTFTGETCQDQPAR